MPSQDCNFFQLHAQSTQSTSRNHYPNCPGLAGCQSCSWPCLNPRYPSMKMQEADASRALGQEKAKTVGNKPSSTPHVEIWMRYVEIIWVVDHSSIIESSDHSFNPEVWSFSSTGAMEILVVISATQFWWSRTRRWLIENPCPERHDFEEDQFITRSKRGSSIFARNLSHLFGA